MSLIKSTVIDRDHSSIQSDIPKFLHSHSIRYSKNYVIFCGCWRSLKLGKFYCR
ncbi:hypothetical protein RhiirA1_20484 [Rhizophagus irregularis]|uniref:Uncharacterized protein n=1 Tax=Rhizophagus irregularis TaxID=588596 RepID=A0A2N0RAS9_9GLOM|nr:hypothetical protein RhiirA1_20484 [Rhizophagus irregularis]